MTTTMFGLPNVSTFRFTIRDVLWLTLVVALLARWHLDHDAAAKREAGNAAREDELKQKLADAENPVKAFERILRAANENRGQTHFPLYFPPEEDLY